MEESYFCKKKGQGYEDITKDVWYDINAVPVTTCLSFTYGASTMAPYLWRLEFELLYPDPLVLE